MSYQEAKKKYAYLGVDTEKAIRELKRIPISMHCWQGDDVTGFENAQALTGFRVPEIGAGAEPGLFLQRKL